MLTLFEHGLVLGCRMLPETVNNMKSHIDTLLETTNTMMGFFKTFSEKVDGKFENLNDRITSIIIKINVMTSLAHRPCPISVQILVQ